MSVWFEGQGQIDCDLDHVRHAAESPGDFFAGVVRMMPGMSNVELVDAKAGSVTIKTNEGLMKRTDVSSQIGPDQVVIEFDEQYAAGSRVTTNAHFRHSYTAAAHGVTHQMTIRDLTAPGLLGFFYRRFGASKMGKAFLEAHKAHLEQSSS